MLSAKQKGKNMAITYTGTTAVTSTGKNYQAKDITTGDKILVKISRESLQDHGENVCRQKGDEKHSNGKTEQDGSIIVRTADFK